MSALVDRNGLPLVCIVSPANVHDSRLYEPTLEAFEIPKVLDHPGVISADATYDALEIRQYNRKRGIKSNIPVNWRSRKHPKRGRPFWFDPELYKKHSAVERFFSWIEALKKIVPRYERYEHSFMGLIHLACRYRPSKELPVGDQIQANPGPPHLPGLIPTAAKTSSSPTRSINSPSLSPGRAFSLK
ncbi:transposase [Methanoculleus receptaculi]|uniref:transposase n=1 Tax=Methanoculleus receptaculi TaxID=394967 RepID=UPI00384BBEDB